MRVEEVEEEEEPTTPVVSCFSVMSDTIQPLGQPLGIEFELNRSGKSGMSNDMGLQGPSLIYVLAQSLIRFHPRNRM